MYNNLVTQWNQNHNNWTLQEQVDFVTQIIDVAPVDKVSYWHCVRAELRGQLMVQTIYNTDPNSLYPQYNIGGYPGFHSDLEGIQQDTNFSNEIIMHHPDEYTNNEKIQAYKAMIALTNVWLNLHYVQLNSNNFSIEQKLQISRDIESERARITEWQGKIKELLEASGIIENDSAAVQTQVNNTPSAD